MRIFRETGIDPAEVLNKAGVKKTNNQFRRMHRIEKDTFFSMSFVQQLFLGISNYTVAIFPVFLTSLITHGFSLGQIVVSVLSSNELAYAGCVVGVLYLLEFFKSADLNSRNVRIYTIHHITAGFFLFLTGLSFSVNVLYQLQSMNPDFQRIPALSGLNQDKYLYGLLWALLPLMVLFIQRLMIYSNGSKSRGE